MWSGWQWNWGKTQSRKAKILWWTLLPSDMNISLMSGFKWALLMVPAPKNGMFLPKLGFAMVKTPDECSLGHSIQPWKAGRLRFCGKGMFATLLGKGVWKDLCRLCQSYWSFCFYSWKLLLIAVLCRVWLTVQVEIVVLKKPWFCLLAASKQRYTWYPVLGHYLSRRLPTETVLPGRCRQRSFCFSDGALCHHSQMECFAKQISSPSG